MLHTGEIVLIFSLSFTAFGMDCHGPTTNPRINEELKNLAMIERVAQPLHVSTLQGKIELVSKTLDSFPEYLRTVLDCNQFKCPLETAIVNGHFDITHLILVHMREHIPHKCINDLFLRWNRPMIFDMIEKGNKPAVKFILGTILENNFKGDGLDAKFEGMTAL